MSGAEAFSRAYDEYGPQVYAAAYTIVRDAARAQDVTHDVFLALWRDPSRFDASRGDLGVYLRLLARSRALDAWRRGQAAAKAHRRLEALGGDVMARSEESPTLSSERAEASARLRAALLCLPQPQRETIVLAYWGGLTVEQVARRVDVPLGTAKSRMRLGLARLRAELESSAEPFGASAASPRHRGPAHCAPPARCRGGARSGPLAFGGSVS